MKKNCLFIDDGEDIDAITERLMLKGKSLGIDILCEVFNPMEDDFLNEDFSMNIKLVIDKLQNVYLRKKVDLIACDYQLGDKVIFGDDLLRKIRQFDGLCSFILYSGALEDVIKNIIGDQKSIKMPEKILENIQGLVNSKISRFIRKGNENTIIDESINILKNSPMEQLLVNNLLEYEHMSFNGIFPEFNGKKVSEIVNFLKKHTNEGIRFSNEIVEQSVSLTIDIDNVR